MVAITELQKVGVGLVGFGLFFLLFGVLLYFDSVLLAFGNVLFLAGLMLIIGVRRTSHFFFQRHKLRGSAFFLGGVALVLCRWPVIGMLVESYGFVLLFRSFFPTVLGFVLSAVNVPFLSAQQLHGVKAPGSRVEGSGQTRTGPSKCYLSFTADLRETLFLTRPGVGHIQAEKFICFRGRSGWT
ncbi:vesicle transport protein GOT1A isoform X2 [Synchiropus splendidus]|uniref:vesicle transport protein GOT1A isoform X2 n=1 Tax=Synchiropus splendidus TaxID=270530 RepID=UPI00237E40F7|nr:vesicle transport protein GOT1A isoform X2 [Synchiropus splendidus]